MDAGDPGALLLIEIIPEGLPLAVGENFTIKDVLPPGAIVTGIVRPDTLNPLPDGVI
jgi:hypothetical protein